MVSGNRGKDVKHVPALRVSQTEKAAGDGSSDLYGDLAPQVGLEPTTLRLTAECSAIELLRNNFFPITASDSIPTYQDLQPMSRLIGTTAE